MASVRRTLPVGVAHSEKKGPAKLVDVRAPALRTRVRFPASPPTWSHLEPPSEAVEQFLAMLRFEQRHLLDELPAELIKVGSDGFFDS